MAASRDDPVQDCLNNLTKYNSAALFLAIALQDEDADKFIEVYDNVIPANLALNEVSSIKDKARELATLPPETLETLKEQYTVSKKNPASIRKVDIASSESLPTSSSSSSFLPKCLAPAMEGATPLYGAPVSKSSRNESKKTLSKKTDNIWNNNNNIETSRDTKNIHSVISFDILNGNGIGSKPVNRSSNTALSSVPKRSSGTALLNSKSHCAKISYTNKSQTKGLVSVAPYSKQELLESAVELIDSRRHITSSTCPKPAFVDPSKPDQVLQEEGGKLDMAAAANSASTNTKKTELRGVRLTSANKNPLPNGSINNKKPPGVSTSQKVNNLPNDETPLMGNSQRTDSSVCVKQYGTNVPSNRHDHSSMATYSMESDEPQDKSKLVLSSGESDSTVTNKPTTLGEQFEARKAIESKKKRSKKKKKKGEPEKPMPSPVAVTNDEANETFEDAPSEFTSNEEFSSATGGITSSGGTGTRPTIASKLVDGTFHVEESKTLRNAESESLGGNGGDVTMINCKKDAETDNIDTTHKTSLVLTNDSKPKLSENDKMLSNNRKLDSGMFTMTAHSTDINDPSFLDTDETNVVDDDGEFQQVMSSKKSRRLNRKTKGVSMEDKLYTHQNKQLDKDQLRGGRAGNSSGMRKSSSEPAGMARLGEAELEQHNDNNYLRKFPNRNMAISNQIDVAVDNNKQALVTLPPKPNSDVSNNSGTVTISYAGKVKAGIAQHQVPKNNPVKFTLDDEHSDGHVSDSGIVIPQIDTTTAAAAASSTSQNQRTTSSNVYPSNVVVSKVSAGADTKCNDEVNPLSPPAHTTSGGTSPKFEISFGEFRSVYISGAPKSLKTSCGTTSSSTEGLHSSARPLQKVARSNSIDGLASDGANISENTTHSTTQQHQEADVQYLDLQSTNNTYAGMLKRRLPPHNQATNAPVQPQVVEETVRVKQNNPVMMEPGKCNENEHSNKKVVIETKPSQSMQVAPPQEGGKLPVSTTATRVENKSHQELKAVYNTSNQIIASPTPSIASSKGASRSVCIPLSMEPMDLGITFGDVNISEVLKEQEVAARQGSPVDKILAGADASGLPQVPSAGLSCTDLETAWRDESKEGSAGDMAGNQRDLGMPGVQMTSGGDGHREITNIGNFNYYEVADMLMKAWMSTLEQKEANPSKVQYYTIDDNACI